MKKIVSLILASAMALSLSACGGKEAEETKKDTLAVGVSADVISMNPQAKWANDNNLFITQAYDTLVTLNNDLTIEPSLATSWTWIDDTTLEMKLRDDVTFHNGAKMTADDVVYTLQKATTASAISSLASMIDADKTVAVDEYTVQIGLQYAFPALLTQLAHPNMSIMCKAVVEADYEGYGSGEIVGTGPFVFNKTVPGDATYYDTYPEYWGTVPEFAHLTLRTISENSQRSIAVETGEIDLGIKINAAECTRLESIPNINLDVHTTGTIVYVCFNAKEGPFADPAVREAFTYGIDTQALVDICYEGWATRAVGMLTPNAVGYDPTIVEDDYAYDLEKAKQIMADAGYADGINATLMTTSSRAVHAEAIQAMAAQFGVNLEIETKDVATWLEDLNTQNYEISMVGKNSGATGDAYYGLYTAFHSSSISNQGAYYDDELDALLDEAASTVDDAARNALYSKIQHMLMEPTALPWLSIAFDFEADAYGPSLASYDFCVNTFTRFNTAVLA